MCVYAAQGGTLFQAQTITFGALADKTFGDADFAVSATASSGLPVSFSASGDCTVSGTTVHLVAAGSCTITAKQGVNASWNPAADVPRAFAIAKGSQTVSFTSPNPTPVYVGATYTPTATATSGLVVAITLDATSTGVCSLASGVVLFTAPGTCVINANQAGTTDWNAAPQQQQSVVSRACIGTEAELRSAAAAGGSFDFCAPGTTILLTAGAVAVGTTLTLNGVGGVNGVVNGNNASRVFFVTSTGSLTLNDAATVSSNQGIAITQCLPSGGGVNLSNSTLVMNGTSTVRLNSVAQGGGVAGGVSVNGSSLTMNATSAITDNTATGGFGGGVYFFSTTPNRSLVLSPNARISGNVAADGGGIFHSSSAAAIFAGVTSANVVSNSPNNCAGLPVSGCVNP